MATFGFQAYHLQDLLAAEPFRPFEIYLLDNRTDYRIDDPEGVTFRGDVLVIRDEGREDWVPLASIAIITVLDHA
jgi:hypothetical protein